MNAKSMPGFTAEKSVSKTIAHYRAAIAYDAGSDQAYVRQALRDACLNLTLAYMKAPEGSFEEEVFYTAYYKAGCNAKR
jgi:hypothetical protein